MHRYLPSLSCLLLTLAAGCQPADSSSDADSNNRVEAKAAVYSDADPREYLAAVFGRYRNASAYTDQGEVRLIYEEGGEAKQQVAPSRIWLDHNQLYVEAYDVRLWSDSSELTCWIVDPASDDFDSQVVRRPIGEGRPQLEALFADPVLVDRVAAGLAGPPPQLEWLFAAEPMSELFAGDYQFDLGRTQQIDGRVCQSVRVMADQHRYIFWIDRVQSLVRRIEFPPVVAPLTSGAPVQTMPLMLELKNAAFSSGVAPQPSPLPQTPRYVARFVPLPPPRPASILGNKLSPFSLSVGDRTLEFGKRPPGETVTLLLRYDGDATSVATLAALQTWQSQMPSELRQRVQVVVLLQPEAARLPDWCSLMAVVDRQQLAVQRLGLQSAQSAVVTADGRIQWKQEPIILDQDTSHRDSQLVYLGAVVGDILQGIDVPGRLAEQWTRQVQAYQQALQQQTLKQN